MNAYVLPNAAGTNTANTAETVVATLPGVFVDTPNQKISLDATAVIVPGTSATGIRVRLRRGTDTSGTLVADTGATPVGVTAGVGAAIDLMGSDTPAEGGPYSYVLTIAQTAGAAAGVIPTCSIQAIVFP